jgi:PAS domain S-box-containing protein
MKPITNWGNPFLKSPVVGYGSAVGLVALLLGARLLLFSILGTEIPFLFFLPAVFFTAWVGGLGPGLLATACSTIGVNYLLLRPIHSLTVSRPADQLGLLLYVLICILTCWWIQRVRRALLLTAETRALARQAELLKQQTRALEEANEALRRRELQLRKLSRAVEQSPASVVITDPTGAIEYVNPKFTQVTGYSLDEVLGRNPRVLKSGEMPSKEYRRLWETITAGNLWQGEFHNRRKDGTLFWEAASISPVLDEHGVVTHFVAVKEDITERKKAEAMLALRADELARSNRDLEQFAYVASHDLQEPLRAVSNYLELLARRYPGQGDEKAGNYIRFAVQGASRMQTLIDDLLAFSRVGSQRKPFDQVDTNAAARQALDQLRKTIRESGAVVTRDHLPSIQGDYTGLVQVFQNLLGNAIKFKKDGPPEIHISAERQDQSWVFSVRDNGIGVAPEHAGRIFEVFNRLHSRDEIPGSGVGLAICKRIVEYHEGRIWVESRLGEGSTFRFTIPASHRTVAENVTEGPAATGHQAWNKERSETI